MKRIGVSFSFKQAVQGFLRNGVMTFASVAVLMSCLVVIGGFALIVLNININLNALGDLNQIVVFADAELGEEELSSLGDKIASLENVTSVEHITKAQALENLRAQAGDKKEGYDYINETNNPLSDEFIISYEDVDRVVDLDYALNHMEGISKVNNRLDLASGLESFRSGVFVVFGWFLVILVIVTVFIIINTIKLSVYSRRHEITVMRYVGATGAFITAPFVIEGILIGLFSSVIAYFVEWYAYYYMEQRLSGGLQMIKFMSFTDVSGAVLGGFIVIGILTGIFGSMISLRKYLKA